MRQDFNSSSEELERTAPSSLLTIPGVLSGGIMADVFSTLLREKRVIMVQDPVEPNLAAVVTAQLKYLEAQDPTRPIILQINSPGGMVEQGLAIFDIMQEVKCPIITWGLGDIASMGSVLLVGGGNYKVDGDGRVLGGRFMTENAFLMVHQGGTGARGQPSDVDITVDLSKRVMEKLPMTYEPYTGLTREYWKTILERDTWFSAQQAMKIGFIDEIIRNPDKRPRYEAEEPIPSEFLAEKERQVAKMTTEEILKKFNSPYAQEEAARLRPEMAVALAQDPRFWTKEKQLEFAAKNGIDLSAAKTREQATRILTEYQVAQGEIKVEGMGRRRSKKAEFTAAASGANDNKPATRARRANKPEGPVV